MPETTPSVIRVLIVEDNPGDARLLQELLAESNGLFEVEQADRLSDAIARLQQGNIDLVLSDLSLPDSHGLETSRRLHEAAPFIPVIILSGLNDESLAVQTVEQGAQDYLVKGHVDNHLLVRAIRYAIQRAESDRQLAQERTLLRNVVNNLLDAIYVKDTAGRYIMDNAAHRRALGVRREQEVIGKTVDDFFPPEIAARFHEDDQNVLRTGEPIINRQEISIGEDGVKKWLSTTKVPLRNEQNEITGIVGIWRDITARKRSEEQAGIFHTQIREKNAQLEEDLQMAREMQLAFLPQQFPTFPKSAPAEESGLQFFTRYQPTTAVGGDFFQILPLSDTAAGVLICDVMGHGVRAALVTAMQRALVEEHLDAANDPGEFLTQMNRALLSILRKARTPMFASAFYMVADIATGEITYANAGHPRALHVRRNAKKVEPLAGNGKPGPALGVLNDSVFTTFRTDSEINDLVMLFTDGVYEVEGPGGEYFDEQRLLDSVKRRLNTPTQQLFDDTLAEIRAYSATHAFADDVCIVGIEIEHLTGAMEIH